MRPRWQVHLTLIVKTSPMIRPCGVMLRSRRLRWARFPAILRPRWGRGAENAILRQVDFDKTSENGNRPVRPNLMGRLPASWRLTHRVRQWDGAHCSRSRSSSLTGGMGWLGDSFTPSCFNSLAFCTMLWRPVYTLLKASS